MNKDVMGNSKLISFLGWRLFFLGGNGGEMNRKLRLIILFGCMVLVAGCSKDSNPLDFSTLTFSHSMKGWELYSWPGEKNWNYSILMGTNRLKSYEEVTSNEIIVKGEESLMVLLSKLPAYEEITWKGPGWLKQCWGGNYHDLSLPPYKILNKIIEFCAKKNLQLHISI